VVALRAVCKHLTLTTQLLVLYKLFSSVQTCGLKATNFLLFLFYFKVAAMAYRPPGRATEGCCPPPFEGAP
jgi:hypothetical protein